MKKTLLTLALVGFSAAATYAQGTIQFLNTPLQKLGFIQTPGGVRVDAPAGTVIGVYWGTPGTAADALQLVPATTVITTPGQFNGGSAYPVPGTNPGDIIQLKIAGWLNLGGTTPATITGRLDQRITHYGESAVVTTTALGPTTGPGTVIFQSAAGTNPNRVKPFDIILVPEPSVMALGALGLGALLLRRRKA